MRLHDLWTAESTWQVPEGWRQGRGAWGGLVVGQILTAASAQVASPELTPRSMWVGMLGPVLAGPVQCDVAVLRRGSATESHEVTLRDASGEILTRATVVFGAPRQASAVSDPPAAPPDPAPQPGAEVALGPPMAPEFTPHLRFVPILGFPYSGSTSHVTAGWVGLAADSDEPLTTAVVGALIDAWWTASLTGIDSASLDGSGPPVATLDFALTFPNAIEPVDDVWQTGLWHVGRIVGGHDGYLTEQRSLYAPDGRLLALNTQIVAVGRRRVD